MDVDVAAVVGDDLAFVVSGEVITLGIGVLFLHAQAPVHAALCQIQIVEVDSGDTGPCSGHCTAVVHGSLQGEAAAGTLQSLQEVVDGIGNIKAAHTMSALNGPAVLIDVDVGIVSALGRIHGHAGFLLGGNQNQRAVGTDAVVADPVQQAMGVFVLADQVPGVGLLMESIAAIAVPDVAAVFLQEALLELDTLSNGLTAALKLDHQFFFCILGFVSHFSSSIKQCICIYSIAWIF